MAPSPPRCSHCNAHGHHGMSCTSTAVDRRPELNVDLIAAAADEAEAADVARLAAVDKEHLRVLALVAVAIPPRHPSGTPSGTDERKKSRAHNFATLSSGVVCWGFNATLHPAATPEPPSHCPVKECGVEFSKRQHRKTYSIHRWRREVRDPAAFANEQSELQWRAATRIAGAKNNGIVCGNCTWTCYLTTTSSADACCLCLHPYSARQRRILFEIQNFLFHESEK